MKRIQDPLSWSELKLVWEEEGRKKQTLTPKEIRVTLDSHGSIDRFPEIFRLREHLIETVCPFYPFQSCGLNTSLRYNHFRGFNTIGHTWYNLYPFNQYFSYDL